MEKLDIILWILTGGVMIIFGLLFTIWTSLNHRLEQLTTRLNIEENSLSSKIGALHEKLTDIDLRLCHLDSVFSNKDCCKNKDERHVKKAE